MERLEGLLDADRKRFEGLIKVAESGGEDLRNIVSTLKARS